jgi:thiol-disulfide isomerase/thioredoxin
MSFTRRTLLAAALAASASAAFAQAAGEPKAKFTLAAFEAAQAAGKSILVEVSASWCPTCKAQAPIIKALTAKPEFRDVAVFEVDFDSQKNVLQMLKVRSQSTLITFKGKAEVTRTTGETKAAAIEKQLKAAI